MTEPAPPNPATPTAPTFGPFDDERWQRLRSDLTRAVRRQATGPLATRADDIVQAAMLKVMDLVRRSATAPSPSSSGPEGNRELTSFYLYRVAHSALIDEIRRLKRRREVSLDTGGSDDGEGDGEGMLPEATTLAGRDDPERSASSRQLGAAIRECLAAMKAERRVAVALHLQGHSVPEAARLLAWAAKRTENLVYRGLADLRQCLVGKGHRP